MANVDAPYGLRAVRHMTGGEVRANVYTIASGYNTSIFSGDVVEGVAGGSIELAEAQNVDNVGVFAGVSYTDSTGKPKFSKFWPADTVATNIEAYVYDDPDIIFAIQSDATGVAAADIHNGADWEVVAGDTTVGTSKWNLDVSAGLGTTGKSLRILRIIDDGENAAGAYADVEVIFNEHVMKGVVSGVGGI